MKGAVTCVQVKAFDRKGVQFFRFSTPVSSDIIHLEVVNSTLYAFAEYSVTVFEETTEKSFYLAPERITCATIVPMRGTDGHMAALGCQDSCIRLLDGNQVVQVSHVVRSGAEHAVARCMRPQHRRSLRAAFDHTSHILGGSRAQEVLLDAAPSALTYCALAHDAFNQHPTRKELFVGLSNGDVGQIFVDATSHHFGAALPNVDRRGAINQVYSAFDMTGNGMNEVAVGREDGRFEVYDMAADGTLQLVCARTIMRCLRPHAL